MTSQRWAIPPQNQMQEAKVMEAIAIQNPELSVKTAMEMMKKLTVVAVSTITFLRDVFPEDAYSVRQLEGQKVYLLRREGKGTDSETLCKWLTSAFELVNSHHLKKMFLLMKQGDVTLEVYTFSFTYDKDAILCDLQGEVDGREVLMSQSVPEDISKSIRILIRAILLSIYDLKPLPNGFEMCMKLQLDETTPEDKVPSLFHLSSSEVIMNFPIHAETLKLGKVESRFVTFGVTTKSVLTTGNYENICRTDSEKQNTASKDVEEVNTASEDVEEVPASQVDQMTSVLNTSQCRRKSHDIDEPDNNSYLSDTNKGADNDSNLSEALSIVNLKEKTMSCICECGSLFGSTIQCVSCSTFQHKTCYKLLECHNVDIHICVSCHDPEKGKICSVPELLNDVNRKALALYRQALMYCCTSAQVSCKRIMTHLKVPRRVAEKILQELDNNGCFEPTTNKGHIRNVRLDLKENIGQYFIAPPSSSDSTRMNTQNSPVVSIDSSATARKKTSSNLKRQLEEVKENTPPELTVYSTSKRSRIMKSTTNVTESMYNY